MKLIDASELIKRLENSTLTPTGVGVAKEIINSLPDSQVNVPSEWISVEKELPKVNDRFLCIDPNSPFEDKREIVRFDLFNKSWHLWEDIIHPSHWQPLPKKTIQ